MLFVRPAEGRDAEAFEAGPAASAEVDAETLVALDRAGPFRPLARAVEDDARIRDALARELPIPSLRGARRIRAAVAVLAVAPWGLLAFIDARVAFSGIGGPVRYLLFDLLLATFVAHELARPTPRMPAGAALAVSTIGLSLCLLAARLCGEGLSSVFYLAPAAAFAGALLLLFRVPRASRVALELLDKLGISRSDALAVTRPSPPTGPLVGFALAAAIGLPALLYALGVAATSLGAQAVAVVAYALIAPLVGRRLDPAAAEGARSPRAIVWGVFAGLALTVAIMGGARAFVDTGTEVARCLGKLDAEAKALLAREASELSRAIARVRGSAFLFALTAVVFPFAEERIYRGLLLHTLARKYGASYGLFASAIVFGFAHVGVYQVGLYQTVLLGLAFGLAYLEGGIVASVTVHAAWNLLLLI